MTRRIRRALAVVATLAPMTLACGGGTPPPPMHPDTAEADAAPAPASVEPAASPAAMDAGATTSASSSPSTPPPAETSKPPADLASAPDDCRPASQEFEKKVIPKINECYREGKKNEKDLKGKIAVELDIDVKGKVKSTKIKESTLPDAVAQCMLKGVKAIPFTDAGKCAGKAVTIIKMYPTQ